MTVILSAQLLQQRLCLLQIGSIKPFGEPAIDRGKQLAGLGAFALLLPQATEAHSGPQLQRFRLLAAGDVQGALEAFFRSQCRTLHPAFRMQKQDTLQATDFRFPPAFLMLLHQGVGLGQRLQALFRVAQMVVNFRQQVAKVRQAVPAPPPPVC